MITTWAANAKSSYYHDDDDNDDDYYYDDDNDENDKDMSRLATLQSVDTMWEEDDNIDDNDNDNNENVVLVTSALKKSQAPCLPHLSRIGEKLPVTTPLMLLLLILLLQRG